MSEETGRISVSRDALRAELADLELRLIKTLVTKTEHDALTARVNLLEQVGSPHAQELEKKYTLLEREVGGIASWRNRIVGAIAVISFVVAFSLPVVVQHYIH